MFVPDGFPVPALLQTELFRLRMLSIADVDKDYEAVMESARLLRTMFGRGWPREGFTREENWQDLAQHQAEFLQRLAFAYTVMSPDESRCLGCVYIDPLEGYPEAASVRLWVRQSAHDQGLDSALFRTIRRWLDDCWPFERVVFPGRGKDGTWTPQA